MPLGNLASNLFHELLMITISRKIMVLIGFKMQNQKQHGINKISKVGVIIHRQHSDIYLLIKDILLSAQLLQHCLERYEPLHDKTYTN